MPRVLDSWEAGRDRSHFSREEDLPPDSGEVPLSLFICRTTDSGEFRVGRGGTQQH